MKRLAESICVILVLAAGTRAAWAAGPRVGQEAVANLKAAAPQAIVYQESSRIKRIGGQPLAFGRTPREAAEQFRQQHAGVFGVGVEDLVSAPVAEDGLFVQPVMYEPDLGKYKFMLVRYTQQKDGIPVFRADLRLLSRNEPGFPLVLAASGLRNLGAFVPDRAKLRTAFQPAAHVDRPLKSFSNPQAVIWAGVDDSVTTPVLAYTFVAEKGSSGDGDYERWLYVVDAANGQILYRENQIIRTDIAGNVSGMATTGPKADFCAEEQASALPWATVSVVGGSSTFTDANGNFTVPNSGSAQVTVQSSMSGQYFFVDNVQGAEETLSLAVTPPGPANFLHNAANTDEQVRAQINGYLQANVVRDFCLTYNPDYPTISTQTNFPVYVNRTDGYCPGNAWYDYSSINFCLSGSGYPNTAWSNIIHHEYGHHMVSTGGSGQGQYGEGMSDCIAMLIADDPVCGYGFNGDCNSGIRTGDNSYQYPCSGEAHVCGQLISGCVWSTRNELLATNPTTYLQILSNLTVNSILLHTGTLITPQITIDFLTLDDNDGNINNGTPHRAEICAGFGAHNMACPPLPVGLSVIPAVGLESGGPVGGPFSLDSRTYTLENLYDTPIDYSVSKTAAWLDLSNTSGTLAGHATTTVVVSFNANAESLDTGAYTDAVSFTNLTDHVGDTTRPVSLAVGEPGLLIEWNLDTSPGWSVQEEWRFGQPTGQGGGYGYPDPTSGYTGTNVYGINLNGNYWVYELIGMNYLTAGPINLTGVGQATLKFRRWLNTDIQPYVYATIQVSNNGTNWTTIWSNSEGEIAEDAWSLQSYDISAVADNQPSVYLRWGHGVDNFGAVAYSGWNIDDIQIWGFASPEPTHTLDVGAVGQGSVALDPTGPIYPEGTTVTLTANPAATWHFDHWEGDLTGSTNPATLVMDADKTVTAVFARDTRTLTVNVTGQGTVALNPPGGTYPYGTTVTLTANAAAGWRFDHWEGGLAGSANPTTLWMIVNYTVTAVFVQDVYTLTVNTTGQGSVALNPPGGSYSSGTTVTLTATSVAGWHFDHWEGALTGSTNPTTLLMDSNKTVTAVFVQDTYTLTVNITGQGSVALNPPGGSYVSGTTVTLTATPVAPWSFDHWEGALTGSANPTTLLMNSNKTVTAVFLNVPPSAPSNVTATALGGGQARVTWRDNSGNETGFQIERQKRVGSSWTNTTTFNVGANVTTYTDTPGAGQFRYRVRAFNGAGYSAWSAYATVKVR